MTKPGMDPTAANSIAYLATSIEAVAARLRGAIGEPEAYRVLEWCHDELDRLSGEAKEIGDEERADESAEAAE